MRVIAYIDGFNLYYGMLKGTSHKWLDLEKFVDALVAPDVEVVEVKYFTAQIKTFPYDLAKVQRQQFFLKAVALLPRIKVIEGFYTKHKIRMPFYKEPCISCEKTDGLASVVKLEEKRSDVNIATEMLMDATSGAADAFMLISGDSDLAGPVSAIRYRVKKPVAVFNPHEGPCDELKRFASFYKNIPRDLPARCQLPDAIPVGTHGNFIRRPAAGGTRSVASDKRSANLQIPLSNSNSNPNSSPNSNNPPIPNSNTSLHLAPHAAVVLYYRQLNRPTSRPQGMMCIFGGFLISMTFTKPYYTPVRLSSPSCLRSTVLT